MADNRTLLQAIIGDGRFLLVFTGLVLILSGVLVIVQSLSGYFLPHDVAFLGLDAQRLSIYSNGTITKFMFHDRIAFGGSIVSVGCLYMWLAEFPLKNNEPWSWYLFLVSGIIGFGSFSTYLGYGYLDTWHGVATLLLFPFFLTGLIRSYKLIRYGRGLSDIFRRYEKLNLKSAYGIGKASLLFSAFGLFASGITIMVVGMTIVFVPEDLAFMNITTCGLDEINRNLVPLIAHDRAGFGGGLATTGILFFFIVRRSTPSVNLWQIIGLSMVIGFSTAIGVHFLIGYTDFIHLAPAYTGALTSFVGLVLTYRRFHGNH